jgi:hypothetical protein
MWIYTVYLHILINFDSQFHIPKFNSRATFVVVRGALGVEFKLQIKDGIYRSG